MEAKIITMKQPTSRTAASCQGAAKVLPFRFSPARDQEQLEAAERRCGMR